jgi:hypothetical protein
VRTRRKGHSDDERGVSALAESRLDALRQGLSLRPGRASSATVRALARVDDQRRRAIGFSSAILKAASAVCVGSARARRRRRKERYPAITSGLGTNPFVRDATIRSTGGALNGGSVDNADYTPGAAAARIVGNGRNVFGGSGASDRGQRRRHAPAHTSARLGGAATSNSVA